MAVWELFRSTAVVYLQFVFDALFLLSLVMFCLERTGYALGKLLRIERYQLVPLRTIALAAVSFYACVSKPGGLIAHAFNQIWSRLFRSETLFATLLIAVTLLWLLGMLLYLGNLLRQYYMLGEQVRKAPVCPADPMLEEAARLLKVPLLERKEIPGIPGAGVFGLRRPVILLPMDFHSRYEEPQRFMIYLHELSHAKRRDTVWHFLLRIGGGVCYLHPPLKRRLKGLEEFLEYRCDREVIRHLHSPTEYAQLLLREGRERSGVPAALFSRGYRELHDRIAALYGRATIHKAKATAAIVAILLLALSANCLLPDYREPLSGFILCVDDRGDDFTVFYLESHNEISEVLETAGDYQTALLLEPVYAWKGIFSTYSRAPVQGTYL